MVSRGNLKPEMCAAHILVQPVTADEALPIRAAVLRPGLALSAAAYAGDAHPEAYHAGAFVCGNLIGVATVFPDILPESENPLAWRLRGMAVQDAFHGLGVGRTLLGHCIDHVAEMGGNLLWCYARTVVLGFYRVMGFQPLGNEFVIPVSGLHYFMARKVP